MYYGAGLSGRALVLMWTAAALHGFLSDRMDPGTGSADLKLGIVKTLSCVFGRSNHEGTGASRHDGPFLF